MKKGKTGPKTRITKGVHVGTYLKMGAYEKLRVESLRRQRSMAFLLREIVEAYVSK